MLDLAKPFPESIAAVDLGSNSFHLIVARSAGGELAVVDRMREMVQLAQGLSKSKRLTRAARLRALDCLHRFGQRLRHMSPGSVRAVGTNTLRSARGAEGFLLQAEEALGHPIETISGIEEARLIYLGVVQSLDDSVARRLVVDIGGGSTELIVGERFQPLRMESLYVGCVTLSRRHFESGEISSARLRAAELVVRRELQPIEAKFRKLGWEQAVGASGTVRAVDAVIRAAGWSDDGITPAALRRVREALLKAGHVRRLRLPGLSLERRRIFPGGFVVLAAVVEALGVERLAVSEGALREGLLYDLVGRIRHEDVRARSVAALADRCHVDWAQASRVELTALYCFDQTADAWKLQEGESRQLLSWAAQLHEIGLDIAHAQYHKHGEYIVRSADLAGFSREGQRVLAALVRAHRRRLPTELIDDLPEPMRRAVRRLAVLLRLAVVLHRSRSPEPLPELHVRSQKRSIDVQFPDAWLDERPLTRAELEQEAAYLAAADFKLTFA